MDCADSNVPAIMRNVVSSVCETIKVPKTTIQLKIGQTDLTLFVVNLILNVSFSFREKIFHLYI